MKRKINADTPVTQELFDNATLDDFEIREFEGPNGSFSWGPDIELHRFAETLGLQDPDYKPQVAASSSNAHRAQS